MMYWMNFSAMSLFFESLNMASDCDHSTAPSFGIEKSRSGFSLAMPAVTHSPPPTRTSTSPVASAVWLATTSVTALAFAFILIRTSLIAGRSASVNSVVFFPMAMAAIPITGR